MAPSDRPAAPLDARAGRARPGQAHRSESEMSEMTEDARTAADLMTAAPRTCSPFSTVAEAALVFADEDCGAVPVVEDGRPVGILTDRDIALAIAKYPDLQARPVSDVMTREVESVAPADPVAAVAGRFAEARVRRLLVVGEDGQLAGILSLADLAHQLPIPDVGRIVVEAAADPGLDPPEPRAITLPPRADGMADSAPRGRWAWARPAEFRDLIRTTAAEWSADKAPRLGAALAFYSILSLAPLLLIAIAVAATFYGEAAASGQLAKQIEQAVGKEGAGAIQEMLKNAHKPGSGLIASLVGFAALLFAASGLFGQLQDAMNTIWEVQPKAGRGVVGFLRDRFFAIAMVLGSGTLLLLSLALSTAVAATVAVADNLAPGIKPALQVGDTLASAVIITLLFALIFKLLPDAKVAWRDVWVGSGLTTVLFLIGKAAIGAYLGRSSYGSAYGAAGSLVVLLVWTYYSAQILFFGAEFTRVFAERYGRRIEPGADAERVTDLARAQQGIAKAGPRG